MDSKEVEEVIYTLVSEMQHQRGATLTTIIGTQEKQGSPYNVDKVMLHRDAIENLWRYLKISVTPKLHILFVHLLIFLERVQGFDDLGEDAGERAHQEESPSFQFFARKGFI